MVRIKPVDFQTDETTAFLTGDSIALTLSRINDDLQRIHCLLQVYRLTLNINKSSFMVIGSRSVMVA